MGAAPRQRSEQSGYAIRYDRISVRPLAIPNAADEVCVEGVFIASEYTGAALISFFGLDDGGVAEVETHLSHRAPEIWEVGQRYGLVWKRDDAVAFT
jgi:putative spermidine/putrescine transport system ATP-binding protein